MKILGIETSCDETAASVVEDGTKVLSNVIASSVDMHAKTGGVVPEVAAREHIRQISPVVDQAIEESGVSWDDIDAIAVTEKPGLISSLLIGINTAQTLSYIHKKPFIPVNHIVGHIYANFLEREDEPQFPIITLTVSGGHNEIVLLKGHHDFEIIGETLDDAAGEAFDKVARMLDLGFPGGPVIAKAAEKGDPTYFNFPRARLDKNNKYNFSFSGLKTAVKTEIQKNVKYKNDKCESETLPTGRQVRNLKSEIIADVAASFQMAVVDVLSDKLIAAAEEFNAKEIHLAGGVSANQLLRSEVERKLDGSIPLHFPKKLIYCTDNAAMIAGAAYFLYQKSPNQFKDWRR